MPLSPELREIPGIALKFTRAGLTSEIIRNLFQENANRDLISDGNRLLVEFKKSYNFNLEGLDNIPNGGILAFNHPSNGILIPAFLEMASQVFEIKNKNISFLMATEIVMSGKFNDKIALPGSIQFITRFHSLYSDNIISTPTVESRKDFISGRAIAARNMIKRLKSGEIVAISPEGHTEIDNKISPIETFHKGAGAVAILAKKFDKPVVPTSIWSEESTIYIKIGAPFFIGSTEDGAAVIEIMAKIAEMLPIELRGPFLLK
ncbi:MAG: 1-acyl-sn-glycerol-3-phosphate acyltransferase [Candidatus Woesebacteria bacterium]|nr:MAG: 1-acyl-sn-glycerol-3-phosphate acyltransferase [Candidatus Woesebacteria bacterium]